VTEPLDPHLPLVEQVVASIARRKCLSPDEADDYASWVRLRLIEDGGAVLHKFQGRSSLSTYLTTVLHNLLRDYRIAKWGKWRPSAAARRLGVEAVQLETLLVRDGFSFAEAVAILRHNHGVDLSDGELEELAGRLPSRAPRRFEGEEALARLAGEADGEDRVRQGERCALARRLEEALDAALAGLAHEDRLILKLHLNDDFSLADVARTLHLEQKPLYRRVERLLAGLRSDLEARGVTDGEVRDLIGTDVTTLRVDYGVGGETTDPGPSKRTGTR
jgi:RNA polymerase sigma factor for flagellar operon FliA